MPDARREPEDHICQLCGRHAESWTIDAWLIFERCRNGITYLAIICPDCHMKKLGLKWKEQS